MPSKALIVRHQAITYQKNPIVLETADIGHLFSRELRAVKLTGRFHDTFVGKNCNVVECVLDGVIADSVKFVGCDWKDSVIRASRFLKSKFGSSSLAYTTFVNTQFEVCRFDDTDFQNCEFDRVVFQDCDFRYLLIKSCRFSRCEFVRCHTNNKLFETCRFSECVFRKTELQIQTVTENFGITISGYEGCLREDRPAVSSRTFSVDELPRWLRESTAHPLHKVSVEYFLKETLLEGSPYLDACAKLSSWLPMFRTANSFVVVLSQWVDFLLWLYGRNEVSTHTLLAAHTVTGQLLSALETSMKHHSAAAGVSGAHLSLARPVEAYLELVGWCSKVYAEGASFVVEGDGSKAYYEQALAPLFANAEAQIMAVVPHNSPWQLSLSFGSASGALFFMALFLATRTQLELSKLHSQMLVSQSTKRRQKATKSRSKAKPPAEPILSLDVGVARLSSTSPTLRLRAYLPGNLLAELKITVGSQQIAKLRKIVRGLL